MSEDVVWGAPPGLDDIAAMAQATLDRLGMPFREAARNVAIRVEDLADEETLETLKIEDPFELTGLYSGVALTLESVTQPSSIPPMIWLYRLAILDEWIQSDGVELEDLVAHVLIHELGHHFGWSDEDMHRALDQADDL
jgi:predicted Zn-dependent protease with MMP-like domain